MRQTNLKVGAATYSQAGSIVIAFYDNGHVALIIESDRGREAVATVNIPEAILNEGEVILKDWSENEGLAEQLEKAGHVKLTERFVPTGFVAAPIAKMSDELIELVEKARAS